MNGMDICKIPMGFSSTIVSQKKNVIQVSLAACVSRNHYYNSSMSMVGIRFAK